MSKYQSSIYAPIHVSESEIIQVDSSYTSNWYELSNSKLDRVLFNLGMDTNKGYEYQANIQHRNRLGMVVKCGRFSGHERTDKSWLESGYASRAAQDKASNNVFVDGSYAARQETVYIQEALEYKRPCSSEQQVEEFLKTYNKE